jgi:DnaK suppressor protein
MASTRVAQMSIGPSEAAIHDRRVQAALGRIERGTFGLCVTCMRPIERKRLDGAPLTERCARCNATAAPAGSRGEDLARARTKRWSI